MAAEDTWAEAFAVAAGHPSGQVMVDMEGVTFIDSSGVRMIVSAVWVADCGDMLLTVVNPSAAVHRIWEICGLGNRIDLQVEST